MSKKKRKKQNSSNNNRQNTAAKPAAQVNAQAQKPDDKAGNKPTADKNTVRITEEKAAEKTDVKVAKTAENTVSETGENKSAADKANVEKTDDKPAATAVTAENIPAEIAKDQPVRKAENKPARNTASKPKTDRKPAQKTENKPAAKVNNKPAQKAEKPVGKNTDKKPKKSVNLLFRKNAEANIASDIETDVAELGNNEKNPPVTRAKTKKKHKFFFGLALFMIIMSIVGVVSTVVFIVDKATDAVSSNSVKDEFTRFLLPVVANDIAPFDNENELSNSAKINCAIWNIMLNHDTSVYKLSETGEFLIPEYDVEYSCKEIFGTSSGLVHRTVGGTEMSFTYNEEKHVYSCIKDLRYLNYAPVITKIAQNGGTYTLTVEYYPPAVRFLSEKMGIEAEAEKTMKYIINRYDGKNTLVAVKFTSTEVTD